MTDHLRLYHGGVPGLHPGDLLVPSPPHVFDGCPLCVARREGRVFTAGEYRAWLAPHIGNRYADQALEMLDGTPDGVPIDPPSGELGIYVTTSELYATWYAGCRAGSLYRVKPLGRLRRSTEDHFESYVVPRARVLQVIRRGVVFSDEERAEILAAWTAADAAREDLRVMDALAERCGAVPW